MSRETAWLIVAGAAALAAVPMLYIGLQNEYSGLVATGFGLFTLGMTVTPVMRLCAARK